MKIIKGGLKTSFSLFPNRPLFYCGAALIFSPGLLFTMKFYLIPNHVFACFGLFLLSLGLVFVLTTDLKAEVYFVDDSASASDSNSGTVSAQPLRTINAALQKTQPGDVVVVRPGDYRNEDSGFGEGVIPVLKSGTDGNEIQILGAGNAIVHSFLIQNCEYVRVSGFQFTNSQFEEFEGWQDMPVIVRDVPVDPENPIDFTADYSQRANVIEAMFSTYFDVISELEFVSGIDVFNAEHITIVNTRIDGYWAGIQCRGCRDITIAENRISHCVNGVFGWEPAPGLRDSLIRDNRITYSFDTGIFIRRQSDNVVIRDNFVAYSGINHISLQEGATNCVIANNDVRRGGYYSETMRFPGSSAINVHSSGEGNLVTDNWASYQIDLTGIDGNGMILDLMEGDSVQVSRNFLLRNMGSGLNLTISPNAIINDNCFVQNGFQSDVPGNGSAVKLSRTQDIDNVIVRNMFINNREGGIISNLTIGQQLNVNFNSYHLANGQPLFLDGAGATQLSLETLEEAQLFTGWELFGESNR